MDYLSRDAAPFGEDLWQKIDQVVVDAARAALVGRRFLPFTGPVGPGLSAAEISSPDKKEVFSDGVSYMEGRRLVRVPQLYEDFWLYWRDIEDSRRVGFDVDLSAAASAAQKLALKEDKMIFYGIEALGLEGLLTAEGTGSQSRGDWSQGEDAFLSVVSAVSALTANGRLGQHTLIMSPDLFAGLHRLQPGTGLMEIDRVRSVVGGRLFQTSILKPGTALLVCAQPQYIDLMVGQDIAAAYTELVDLNHHLRILETAVLCIKSPDAIIILK